MLVRARGVGSSIFRIRETDMFIRKDDYERALYEAEQKTLTKCKEDLAWALSLPKETAWDALIEHAHLIYVIFKGEAPKEDP